MDEIKLLEILLQDSEKISYEKNENFEILKKRAQMLARKFFGEKSHYLRELHSIRYSPLISFVGVELDLKGSFEYGLKKFRNLIQIMIEDKKLSLDKNSNNGNFKELETTTNIVKPSIIQSVRNLSLVKTEVVDSERHSEIVFTKKIAIIAVIENYRHSKDLSGIPFVKHAVNDALRFKQMLVECFDFEESEIILWTNESAVKSTFENDLVYHIRQLTNDTKFIFYYAGHGFYQNSHNKLTCWDTHPFSLDGTTVSIKDILLDPLENSECKQSLIFLDCCSSFLKSILDSRELISNFNDLEFESFINKNKYNAIFMSCSPGEKSYSSDFLNNGIWTWHLIDALYGNQPEAIVKKQFITDNSLRNYLSVAVPKYITKETTYQGTQTPYAKIASTNEFLIRKIVFNEIEIDESLPNFKFQYEKAIFRKIVFIKIKKASGFNSMLFVPKYKTAASNQFVQKIFLMEFQLEIQQVYEKTKEILALKKNEIEYACDMEGGYVYCKYFRYSLNAEHNDKDVTEGKIIRQLLIRAKRTELPKNFDDIFPVQVDELIIPIEGELDFDDIVNKFENLEQSDKGKLSDNEIEGIIEYVTSNNTSIKIDVTKKELIITSFYLMKSMDLIDKCINDIKRISGYEIKLLNTT